MQGATTNPPLVLKAVLANARWSRRAKELARRLGAEDAAAALADEVRLEAAAKLLPLYEASRGEWGIVCFQVDPRNHADADAMVRQGLRLARLAPNLSVKVPVTEAGLEAIRELTARGIPTTGTVSFAFAQVRHVCAAHAEGEKRLRPGVLAPRRQAVLMCGRLDDHLRAWSATNNHKLPENVLTQAGIAVGLRTYAWLLREGMPARLLLAAARGLYHLTEFLNLRAILTIGDLLRREAECQARELAPGVEPSEEEVGLLRAAPDFLCAYEPDGMSPREFADWGPTRATLAEFANAQQELADFLRDGGTVR